MQRITISSRGVTIMNSGTVRVLYANYIYLVQCTKVITDNAYLYTITEFGYIINHFFTTSIDNEIEIPIMQDMVPIQLEHCLIIFELIIFLLPQPKCINFCCSFYFKIIIIYHSPFPTSIQNK